MPVSAWSLAAAVIGLLAYGARRSRGYRRVVLATVNLCCLSTFFPTPLAALPAAAFLASGYLAVGLVDRTTSRRRLAVLCIGLVGLFIYLKRYAVVAFLPGLPFTYSVIGLSYVLFRVLHVVIDRA